MERWSISQYKKPFLDIQAINISADTNEVEVTYNNEVFSIEIEEGNASEVADVMSQLGEPNAQAWQEVLDIPVWMNILQNMDDMGIVGEAKFDDSHTNESIVQAEAVCQRWCEIIGKPLDGAGREHLLILFNHFQGLCHDYLREQQHESDNQQASVSLASIMEMDNFHAKNLYLQSYSWRRGAPLSLLAANKVIAMVLNETLSEVENQVFSELAQSGLYDLYSVESHLQCIDYFFSQMQTDASALMCQIGEYKTLTRNGAQFMQLVEKTVITGLNDMGYPAYLKAVEADDAPKSLAFGCYLEEYYVTKRFVEMITPLMSKRFNEPLRQRIYQYFSEEVGHEVFELATCKALGIDEDFIHKKLPLPMHVAYVDLFTLVSDADVVAFFSSLALTEGFLGKNSPIEASMKKLTAGSGQYDEVAGKHSELNESLNHTSLSRLFMQEVDAVSPSEQTRALNYVMHLLELNQRTWDLTLAVYSQQDWQEKATKSLF